MVDPARAAASAAGISGDGSGVGCLRRGVRGGGAPLLARAPAGALDGEHPRVLSEAEAARRVRQRRYEALLALPAFVEEHGGRANAARALDTRERDLYRWLKDARTMAAFGFDWAFGTMLTVRHYVRPQAHLRSRFVVEKILAWKDAHAIARRPSKAAS